MDSEFWRKKFLYNRHLEDSEKIKFNIKMDFMGKGCEDERWVQVAYNLFECRKSLLDVSKLRVYLVGHLRRINSSSVF